MKSLFSLYVFPDCLLYRYMYGFVYQSINKIVLSTLLCNMLLFHEGMSTFSQHYIIMSSSAQTVLKFPNCPLQMDCPNKMQSKWLFP